jgi:hypothetical protein
VRSARVEKGGIAGVSARAAVMANRVINRTVPARSCVIIKTDLSGVPGNMDRCGREKCRVAGCGFLTRFLVPDVLGVYSVSVSGQLPDIVINL